MTDTDRIRAMVGNKPTDAQIDLALRTVTAKVKAYCRREDIPAGLQLIIDEMAVAVALDASGVAAVGSVKMGDTQITVADSAANTWLKNYSIILQSWRRIV